MDKELGTVDYSFKVEVVLCPEQREVFFVVAVERHAIHVVSETHAVGGSQTLPG
jgi:hypothetical protein